MTNIAEPNAPGNSLEVRDRIVDALRLDLVGPWAGHAYADEKLPGRFRPSNWYLAGFIIPVATPPDRKGDDDEDDDLEEVPEEAGAVEETNEERKAAKKAFFPSSLGLSFLVPADTTKLEVAVRWGDYEPSEVRGEDGKAVPVWQRRQRAEPVTLHLSEKHGKATPVPNSGGLEVEFVEHPVLGDEVVGRLPAGTRSISVFLINRRQPDEENPDLAYAFQAELEVRCGCAFVPRPDLRGSLSGGDWDEQVADLHYADGPEYATGHGVSADWEKQGGSCSVVRTRWIPDAEVEKTVTTQIEGVELSMTRLGALPDGAAARAALQPIVGAYRAWIDEEKARLGEHSGARRETAEALLANARIAAARIERGIAVLASDGDALDAFRVANRAVARALRKRLKQDDPRWRAFQLAFILLNLPGISDRDDAERELVDLLFFPTGGGKTEAYLGLAAYTMVLRRLRERGALTGAGATVIMRYTLRLLTLDQLARAAGLVCALELEREQDRKRYGEWPFEIGLWVGKAATPNHLGQKGDKRQDTARAKTQQYKANPRFKPSPIPLENCPWCGAAFTPDSFSLLPNDDFPIELRVACANFECEFTRDRPLPIVAVDEPIYRRLPAFLIATVDKFASLPWVATSGVLLGGAERHDANGFYGAADPGTGKRLEKPLPPPDLVIQDELHLIAGPLGTMAGLYETAIEALATRPGANGPVRPKIVASTATVRRANDQIQSLFGRAVTQVFPPPGRSRRDSFFAHTVPPSERPARRYVGIASQGRNPKALMRKVVLALMGAAERAYRDAGGHQNEKNPADPYMTVLGYFNSLRELGGGRRVLEEEVQNTLKEYGQRKRFGEQRGLFHDRKTFQGVVELTSRMSTNQVADARRRLELSAHDRERVDCAIATNMISVGLDVPRLGLMVVNGQPKSHAEYIQATSRVGRDDERPGLVVTLLNIHKPRDRSHYERFRHYHETFYRSVEGGSVTPFSARALDRGFAGALVALARHVDPRLTVPLGAEKIGEARAALAKRLVDVFSDRVRQQGFEAAELEERLRSVQGRVVELLDAWTTVYEAYRTAGLDMQYQRYEGLKGPKPLLRDMLETAFESEAHRKFRTNRSLRDVEPSVNFFLHDLSEAPSGGRR
ncbi:DISARM system helicase DrmA [Anaeromyxobacter oryzae]|uniref:Helicase C-terminal domain-containing protein n=1 Tax=Anaeromyxobacter oryzae TaxID=2918170 RepID=A0ABM7WTL5_9BACT|nr:DISARM system helicase DrmA [Anaeromyxobacter oryzae]BDG02821.1 hypothetical protein AMOR_18170 [Anaeromyxobacter oryzae]